MLYIHEPVGIDCVSFLNLGMDYIYFLNLLKNKISWKYWAIQYPSLYANKYSPFMLGWVSFSLIFKAPC